ncbi:MAG: hypothetical protein BWX45_01269 [Deltaproteobacteria bacterium ADurb.Bin002]|nr:MAG: hypothetical protein BWX45_01269 [Deltaproteobacteria bacterium ADurb.Bin002]
MAQGFALNKRLRNFPHFNGRLDARREPLRLECALKGEAVDHRRQHSHVIGGRALHAPGTGLHAPEDVASSDDNPDLDLQVRKRSDFIGNVIYHIRIDACGLPAQKRFTAEL